MGLSSELRNLERFRASLQSLLRDDETLCLRVLFLKAWHVPYGTLKWGTGHVGAHAIQIALNGALADWPVCLPGNGLG